MRHSLWGAKMTNVVEPRTAADSDDNELASLVRRWMAVRRGGAQRAEPEPPRRGARPAARPPAAERPVVVPDAPSGPAARSRPSAPTRRGRAGPPEAPRRADRRPTHLRGRGRRAARASARSASSVSVCRAYADWTSSDLGSWVEQPAARQGLHSFHQFADDDDQARVAMAIDAVDIARDAAVDEVVLAGDLTSIAARWCTACTRPASASWWPVAAHTPHDVRAACDEFIDTGSLVGEPDGRQPGGTAPETGRDVSRCDEDAFAQVTPGPTYPCRHMTNAPDSTHPTSPCATPSTPPAPGTTPHDPPRRRAARRRRPRRRLRVRLRRRRVDDYERTTTTPRSSRSAPRSSPSGTPCAASRACAPSSRTSPRSSTASSASSASCSSACGPTAPSTDAENSMAELALLAETAGSEVLDAIYPAPPVARPRDLHRSRQGRRRSARSCRPPAPTP